MVNPNAYQQYQENAIKSASRGELTLMLYNGAVKFIRQGIQSVGEKDIQGTHNAITRAQEIITYLSETLDMDYEMSEKFALLYDYIVRRLMEGNVKKDQEILGEALELVEDLRNTWAEALKLSRPNLASGQ
jgi:flagellar protein FliS